MSDCVQLGPLRDAFADGQIEAADAARLREHIDGCPACRRDVHDRAALRRAIQRVDLPEAPRELHDRIRAALDAEDRRATAGRFARWSTVATAALAAAALLLIVLPAGADVPRVVRRSADVHDRMLADPAALRACFERALGARVFSPSRGDCVCPLRGESLPAPWIVYRRGVTVVSLLAVPDDGATLPAAARRTRDGRDYHAFRLGGLTALCLRPRGTCLVWIGRLDEAGLLDAVLATTEGRRAFAGEPLTIRDIACGACCASKESQDVSMELLITGRNLDLERVVKALKEAGDAPRR